MISHNHNHKPHRPRMVAIRRRNPHGENYTMMAPVRKFIREGRGPKAGRWKRGDEVATYCFGDNALWTYHGFVDIELSQKILKTYCRKKRICQNQF